MHLRCYVGEECFEYFGRPQEQIHQSLLVLLCFVGHITHSDYMERLAVQGKREETDNVKIKNSYNHYASADMYRIEEEE